MNTEIRKAAESSTSGSKVEYSPEGSEPSLFTRTPGVLHPRWVSWFSDKFGLSQQMANNVGEALYSHLLREPTRVIDPETPVPELCLPHSVLVSMAFVVDYRHRHGVTYAEAYTAAFDLVAKQREYFPDKFGLAQLGLVSNSQPSSHTH